MEFNFPSPSNAVIAGMEFSGKLFHFFFAWHAKNPQTLRCVSLWSWLLKKSGKLFYLAAGGGWRGKEWEKRQIWESENVPSSQLPASLFCTINGLQPLHSSSAIFIMTYIIYSRRSKGSLAEKREKKGLRKKNSSEKSFHFIVVVVATQRSFAKNFSHFHCCALFIQPTAPPPLRKFLRDMQIFNNS